MVNYGLFLKNDSLTFLIWGPRKTMYGYFLTTCSLLKRKPVPSLVDFVPQHYKYEENVGNSNEVIS